MRIYCPISLTFVVVEFAVNDGNSFFYKKSYDNLVRRILQQENEPALALLFMTKEDGTSAQDLEANIGFQYGLPMISYGNGVLQEMKNNNLAWKDIFTGIIFILTIGDMGL